MDEGFSFREAATLAISTLAIAVSALSAKVWKGHEERVGNLEAAHSQHVHDLTQHAVADAGAHDRIREHLADEISKLNDKIDAKTDALSAQITTQHSSLSGQIFEVLKLIKGGK
jgi:hypothetical protein